MCFFIILCVLISFLMPSELFMMDHKLQVSKGVSINPESSSPKHVYLRDISAAPVNNISRHLQQMIVNGRAAVRGQFCYQVYLQFTDGGSYWSCGGSLVSTRTVLTAAHCVHGATSAIVVLGALDLSQYEFGRLVVSVNQTGLKVHEKYDDNNIYNDIGLVTLSKPVRLNNYICTVALPSCSTNSSKNASISNNNQYTISGWGKTTDTSRTSRLMYVNVSGEPQTSCSEFYKSRAGYTLIQSQMCTSGEGGKSTCNGDSGGPLVHTESSGSVVQQGIVSLGLSSCQTGAPSVYTLVPSFMSWLCPLVSS